ncbi:HEAT repeat domain-containing protein [Luteococcus sp.]|uniref:HEAT repeat domain-containing protein n=1 Tax=Luteococcus sp. TaxID=1969402 RepID=UPI00373585AB
MNTLETLMAALTSEEAPVRQQAALHLGMADASPLMWELVDQMAAEPDDFVRETLIWAVVARPQAATPVLVAALERDGVPKEPVLHALSKIGDPATTPAILPHASDPDPVVAAKAWWALGRIASPESLAVLVGHLGSDKAELRHGLTRALLQYGEPAIDALATALDSEDAAVRSHAAEVLVAFADPSRAGTAERRAGRDFSHKAAEVLRAAKAPEVDGALLLATVTDDRPGLVGAAQELQDERA